MKSLRSLQIFQTLLPNLRAWRLAQNEGLFKVSGRRSLWAALMALVVAVLVTLVWLAGRYEISQLQAELERDTTDAVNDIRSGLSLDVQTLQALQAQHTTLKSWSAEALTLLRDNRDWVRLEWRDARLNSLAFVESPARTGL